MAVSKTRASEMKLQIKHGLHKYDLHLKCIKGDVLTLKHLVEAIFERTGIPSSSQKILFKGKILVDPELYLSDVGLTNGSKLMLLGKKPDPVEDKEMEKLNSIEQSVEKQHGRLSELIHELDGLHRGFMDEKLHESKLKNAQKRISGCVENFMKLLESLDGLRFEEHNVCGRGKRKTLVQRIQKLLDHCDSLSKGMTDMQQ